MPPTGKHHKKIGVLVGQKNSRGSSLQMREGTHPFIKAIMVINLP